MGPGLRGYYETYKSLKRRTKRFRDYLKLPCTQKLLEWLVKLRKALATWCEFHSMTSLEFLTQLRPDLVANQSEMNESKNSHRQIQEQHPQLCVLAPWYLYWLPQLEILAAQEKTLETKTVETKMVETKTVETKTVETKTVETKTNESSDVFSIETKSYDEELIEIIEKIIQGKTIHPKEQEYLWNGVARRLPIVMYDQRSYDDVLSVLDKVVMHAKPWHYSDISPLAKHMFQQAVQRYALAFD
jgi:hypothetical protein